MDNLEGEHEVVGPVIAIGDDVMFFHSAKSAEGWMEAIDVENGEYKAVYDENGRRLRLDVIVETERHFLGLLSVKSERVRISADPAEQNKPAELHTTLVDYFERTKLRDRYPRNASLQMLIRFGATACGV